MTVQARPCSLLWQMEACDRFQYPAVSGFSASFWWGC
jgi:hypothetical protein